MSLDLESLVAAVDSEQRGVDLTGAVLRSGWESVVLETRDGWILRFPRDHVDFERELSILNRLADRLPARIPRVEWTGRHSRFAAYRKLSGHPFDLTEYDRCPDAQRERLAGSLAGFLAAMHHTLTEEEVEELRIPALGNGGEDNPPPFDALPTDVRDFTVDLLAEADALRAERERASTPRVVLHNDFHFQNLVLAEPVGEVLGVWDFSCVSTGDPSDDLRYISAISTDLLQRIARHYEKLTGFRINTRAATLAGRIEVVFDAIELGQVAELSDTVLRWRRTDSGEPQASCA
jgi:aminoglycoside phosphotransferase (APT) family kinase protein